MYKDEFALLGSVGISDVLRLVASATSDRLKICFLHKFVRWVLSEIQTARGRAWAQADNSGIFNR